MKLCTEKGLNLGQWMDSLPR